jgi:hypothetical protein
MALTTIDQILVKQKSMHHIRNAGGAAVLALKAFWMGRNQEGQDGKLYFLAFDDMTVDTVVSDAAAKVHFVYLKKGTSATDAWYKIFDDTANDATAADAMLALGLTGASDEQVWWSKNGLDCASGVVHGSYTEFLGYNGTTASSTTQGPGGFIIVGDA